MLLSSTKIKIPLKRILKTIEANGDFGFSLIKNNNKYYFNAIYLSSISRKIHNLLISDPLADEYNLSSDEDVIQILSFSDFEINDHNVEKCIDLAIELQSDSLLNYIFKRCANSWDNEQILKYAIVGFNNDLSISELEMKFVEKLEELFLSGKLVDTPNNDPSSFCESIKNGEKLSCDGKDGPCPSGLIYYILKTYSSKINMDVLTAIIFAYTGLPVSKKNLKLISFLPLEKVMNIYSPDINQNYFKFLISSLSDSNHDDFYKYYNIIHSHENNKDELCDRYGIMKTRIKPKLLCQECTGINSIYPIINIFNSYGYYKTPTNVHGIIIFDFQPHIIKLYGYLIKNPPEEWILSGSMDNKEWLVLDYSHKYTTEDYYVKLLHMNGEFSTLKIEQPKDSTFQFSINQIEFFGDIIS